MKKLYVLIFLLFISTNACFAFGREKPDFEGMGYVGTLPNLTKMYHTDEPASARPIFDSTRKFNSENELKPVPRDNPAFVNIILKPDKTSPYLNDLNAFLPILEKIYDSIESRQDVQKFNAIVYFFTARADYLREKYYNSPESEYISFKRLMELSMHAKSVSTLRAEAEKYSPYLAYSGSGYIYNSNNIDQQLEYLKVEVEQVINLLKDAD